MEGNTVPVPSYIQAIYQDYQNVWNANKTNNFVSSEPAVSLQAQPLVLLQSGPNTVHAAEKL